MGSEETSGKPRFEPPPWEREAFEALAARRAEEQAATELLAAAAAAKAQAEAAPKAGADPWDEVPNDPVSTPAPDGQGAEASAAGGAPGKVEPPKVQERVVDAMLLQLASEERTDDKATVLVGRAASALTAVLGSGMFVAGIVMLQQTNGKVIAVVGSLVLSVFGMIFAGMAVWVWISTSRSRGR
jgi:hypothetical protein